jgi:hypothetical protein
LEKFLLRESITTPNKSYMGIYSFNTQVSVDALFHKYPFKKSVKTLPYHAAPVPSQVGLNTFLQAMVTPVKPDSGSAETAEILPEEGRQCTLKATPA